MIKMGMLMDSLASIKPYKDTSFALLLEAQHRGFENYHMESSDIWLQDGIAWGRMKRVFVDDHAQPYFDFYDAIEQPLLDLDVLLIRKDPPFDMQYLYLSHLLEQAEAQGLLVLNKPQSLRDANEKLFTAWFPQCCPKTLVTCDPALLQEFVSNENTAVIKPLGGMQGRSVFRVANNDPNLNVIIETLTNHGTQHVMAQQFIPSVFEGDKRVILINGEPVPYALARIPAAGDFRGNIAAGASVEGRELSDRDRWICEQVGPTLKEKGLLFVGLDIIGDYLTEINVTSPTGVRELDKIFQMNICGDFLEVVENLV
jgi:glutathione synthase